MWDKDLPLTPPEWPEWGNPIISREAHDYIASYSPYDNVTAQEYPHLLVLAGLTDPRVTYWEPAKWVAKLREFARGDHLLLFDTNMSAGHAGASGRFDVLRKVAMIYAFALKISGKEF
jgi:oligopeptidase B